MSYMRSILSILFLFMFGLPPLAYTQNTTSPAVDFAFRSYMKSAWDILRESGMQDSLQHVYSKEFYEYYLQNPNTPTGKDALLQAFTMWANTGNDQYVTEVLNSLGYDSEIWGKIIQSVGTIYHQSDSLGAEAYYKLLYSLREKLTDPFSKSAVILSLLQRVKAENNNAKAIELARQLIEINAAEYFTQTGFDYLYELESLNIDQRAPAFRAKTIDGKELSLTDLEGQFVLLDFWISWWRPCLPKIPYLETLWDKYKDSGLTIVGISLDTNKSALTAYVHEREIAWPQVFEAEGWSGEQAGMYNETGIPRTYLIDPNGRIAAKNLRGEELIYEVEKHLKMWDTQ